MKKLKIPSTLLQKYGRNLTYCILIFFTPFLVLTTKIWLIGDGIGYYAWARSLVFDGDVLFENEFTTYAPDDYQPHRTIKAFGNPFPVGPSLLWLPFIALLRGCFTPFTDVNGYEFPFLLVSACITLVFGLGGIVILSQQIRFLFTNTYNYYIPIVIQLSIYSSPLLAYLFDEMFRPQAFSFFFSSLIIIFFIRNNQQNLTKTQSFFWGILIGFSTLMRWEYIFLLVLPLNLIAQNPFSKKIPFKMVKKMILNMSIFLLGIGIAILPQLCAWKLSFGEWIVIPQSIHFFNSERIGEQFFLFLFDIGYGAIIWHPILLLGCSGLILYAWKYPKKGIPLLISALIITLIVSSVNDWWGGAAFGARRIVWLLPFEIFGIIYLLTLTKNNRHRMVFIGICSLLMLWNGILWSAYLIDMTHDTPLTLVDVYKAISNFPNNIVKVVTRSSFVSLFSANLYGQWLTLLCAYAMVLLSVPLWIKIFSNNLPFLKKGVNTFQNNEFPISDLK